MGDLRSQILTYDPDTISIIRDVCRARPDGYQYMKRYRSGYWDGYISLMEPPNKFPTGLLGIVCDALDDHGVKYSIDVSGILTRKFKPIMPEMLRGITLRKYQIWAATQLLLYGRGIAKMATNAGKTEVMATCLKALGLPKAVIVVHRKELMYQTAARLELRLGLQTGDVGHVGDSLYDIRDITVAMVQTLHNRQYDLQFTDNVVLMVDECHHASSAQMMTVLNMIPGSYRFGFSGTPLKYSRLDDLRLIGITGPIVVDVSNTDLINGGWSAKPTVILHTIESDEYWEDSYHDAYEQGIISNDKRNAIITWLATDAHDKLVLILVTRLDHGRYLQKCIGPGCVFVSGSDAMKTRRDVLALMRKPNATGVVIASPIFDEGVDVPGVDVIILAGGGKSHIKLLQRIGRGLRQKPGRNELIVHDFIDDTNKYLLAHSEARIVTYESEGFETRLATSPDCQILQECT